MSQELVRYQPMSATLAGLNIMFGPLTRKTAPVGRIRHRDGRLVSTAWTGTDTKFAVIMATLIILAVIFTDPGFFAFLTAGVSAAPSVLALRTRDKN